MAVPVALSDKLGRLLDYYHRGSLDLPDGLIARQCVFSANGVSFEQTLGSATAAPLRRMLGRGPAAYRFLAQGLRYAIPDGVLCLEELVGEDGGGLVTGLATIRGTPRGANAPLVADVDVALVTDNEGRLVEVGIQIAEPVILALELARRA